jgi:RNA polymerase sigma-70 factor (ECF subfamily)
LKKYSEQQIIAGCRQQKPLFQRALVVQYSGILMGTSLRYARDESAAKDILQDALIKILRAIPKYQDQGKLSAWMKRIVINTALNQMDKGSFRNELYTIDSLPDQVISPQVYNQMAAAELMEVIKTLPESYRTIFNLHAIEGYSHREISQMLHIEESTSRSKLTRARTMLRKLLINHESIKVRI